jgi:hypothetical protein
MLLKRALGGDCMTKSNKEILTTTTPDGETSFMVCDKEESKNEKVCMARA